MKMILGRLESTHQVYEPVLQGDGDALAHLVEQAAGSSEAKKDLHRFLMLWAKGSFLWTLMVAE